MINETAGNASSPALAQAQSHAGILSPDHGETYTSTASFLLRLLVDDRHVCLVAVAKPIPAPAAPLPAAADLIGRSTSVRRPGALDSLPESPASASPASLSPSDQGTSSGLKSLHLAGAGGEADTRSSAHSSLSSSPGLDGRATTSSLFSVAAGGVAPAAAHTRMISPRGRDGRINNTPATSVFSDVFAERGVPVRKPLAELPGPTDVASAPVKKVMSVPPPRGAAAEGEVILGVVSAQLSVVRAASEDHLWFGAAAPGKKGGDEASAVVDVHLLTLATAPEERGQGLGAKLLAALHAECMVKARHMAMRTRAARAVPVVAPLSPRFVDEALPAVGGSKSPYLRGVGSSLESLKGERKRGRFLARTFLEVHPSNVHALALYRAHGFAAPNDDAAAVKRGFYRGDTRIATAERSKRGGTDAWILQRYDGPLPT